MSSAYESGKTVTFQSGIYQISRKMSFTTANASMVTWRSVGKTTIFCDQPDGDFALDIDFTSNSANFVTFNMSNIVFSDIFARRRKKGIKTTRLDRMRIQLSVRCRGFSVRFQPEPFGHVLIS
jgi:hypothetical protein